MIELAIIGAGAPDAQGHLAALQTLLHRVRVVAVAEAEAARREELARRFGVPSEKSFSDFRELLRRALGDLTYVLLPLEAREEALVAVAEAGVHIAVGAPLAATDEARRRILDAVKRNIVKIAAIPCASESKTECAAAIEAFVGFLETGLAGKL